MRNICVIGTGYVGLCLEPAWQSSVNKVVCVDNDISKITLLKKNKIPIYEPGLEEIVRKNTKNKRLSFTSALKDAVKKSEIIFIAVGTPPRDDGSADLSYVETVARDIAESMDCYKLIVDKSTVPVERVNGSK